MLTRVPDYYEAFHCLAGACPRTCCEKWEVVVDEETARRYQETPGSLGERLREALQTDEEGDFCFPLRGGRCPFLNREESVRDPPDIGSRGHVPDLPDPPPVH